MNGFRYFPSVIYCTILSNGFAFLFRLISQISESRESPYAILLIAVILISNFYGVTPTMSQLSLLNN